MAESARAGPDDSQADDGDSDLRTELDIDGDAVDYLVWANRPADHERLVHMGWKPDHHGVLHRRLDNRGDVTATHQRFAHLLQTLIDQSARRIPVSWQHALETMCTRADGVHWWLYGSVALAVRGLPVSPGDVDVAVPDALELGERLADMLIEPVTRHHTWVADWTGRAFDGALLEWSAGAHGSAIEHGPGVELDIVHWRRHRLLVPTLEVALKAATARGDAERAALIRDASDRS